MNIPIAYDDDWLLIVDKPSGLLSVPSDKKASRTLSGILNEEFKRNDPAAHLYPCHRLDKETSGLIVFAKSKPVQEKMMLLFKERRVKKTYLAFLQGSLSKDAGQVNSAIEGLSAQTKFKVLERKNGFSIVEAEPLTGRTNQLRLHFKFLKHPVIGEAKFVFRRDFPLRSKRLLLHAKSLDFIHPVTGKQISIKAARPEYFEKFLKEHNR